MNAELSTKLLPLLKAVVEAALEDEALHDPLFDILHDLSTYDDGPENWLVLDDRIGLLVDGVDQVLEALGDRLYSDDISVPEPSGATEVPT